MTIQHLKLQIAKEKEPLTPESFEEFLKKNYFKRNGRDMEKLYAIGKDLRESLLLKVNLSNGEVFCSWQLFGMARQGVILDELGTQTKVYEETIKFAERLKDVAMILRDDLKAIEKFIGKATS